MLILAKKISQALEQKKKTWAFVLLVLLLNVVGGILYKYTTIIDKTQDVSVINSSKIEDLENNMVTQESFTRDSVKRLSFNAYIKRKDEEYHQQMEVNNFMYSKIGFLEGQLSMLSGILESFKFKVDCKGVDCE